MVDFWCQFFSRFGADFFHGLEPIFFTVYADFSRFVRDINGEKKKNISLSMSFFTVSFSRFAPSRTKRWHKRRHRQFLANFDAIRWHNMFENSSCCPLGKTWFGWEVLNGVDVDGVGGIFPFFTFFFAFSFFFVFFSFFFVFLRFSSLFFAFLSFC